MNSEPIAFFLTWTVYGTFLQGDERGWHRRKQGLQPQQLRLAEWRRERLKYDILELNLDQRSSVEREIRRLSAWRRWTLWACSARSNHVHVVLSAQSCSGATVRDQLKANCTRVLRSDWSEFCSRPVWSVGRDWKCVNREDDLERLVLYVNDAQDRKTRDNSPYVR